MLNGIKRKKCIGHSSKPCWYSTSFQASSDRIDKWILLFKRRMLEGNAGFSQLKCNDCQRSSKASGVTLLASWLQRQSLAMRLSVPQSYSKITEPSISFRKRKSVRTQAGKCGIFTQLIPNFFIAKRKQNKTLFWNRIKDVSSVQWKLHQFKSRQGNHLACKQSGLFRKGAHYGMLCSTSSLVFPMWVEVNLKGRSVCRISVNL